MTDLKKMSKTQKLMPALVGLTLLYSVVYHILMYRAILEEVTPDECAEAAHAGGILPPQCLELDMFRDWHKKETEELLAVTPSKQEIFDAPAVETKSTKSTKGMSAIVVDGSGKTFADTISEDLAGLEKSFSQLVVSSVHLDVKHDTTKPQTDQTGHLSELLHDHMQHELGEHAMPPNTANVSMDFSTFHAQQKARHDERVAHRTSLIKDISQRMNKLDANLADVVSDRKAWEATLLEKYDATNGTRAKQMALDAAVPVAKETFMSKRLQWSAIPTFQHPKVKRSEFLQAQKHPIVVSKGDVKHMHWTGDFPKVAAIAWVRGSRKTRSRMMYFVDNFKLQDYKGPRELLLVYHYKDVEAAEIVKRYADGAEIKGVAAHDFSQESFPSDPALRYAAWASDADVVAQFDFDEWHDPNRLSLQVRAMAYAARHACVLSTRSASHSQEDEDKEIRAVSLVGERAWMKEHWHPISRLKLETLESFEAGQIVELDMQNTALMDSISRIEHVFIEPAKAAAIEPAKAAVTVAPATSVEKAATGLHGISSWAQGINKCLDYDTSGEHSEEDLTAERHIIENIGKDFGKKFHDLLHKRHDVTVKLQLLCFQTDMEKDQEKKKFMNDHVQDMDRIRLELDKHIKNTVTLFGGPKVVIPAL